MEQLSLWQEQEQGQGNTMKGEFSLHCIELHYFDGRRVIVRTDNPDENIWRDTSVWFAGFIECPEEGEKSNGR